MVTGWNSKKAAKEGLDQINAVVSWAGKRWANNWGGKSIKFLCPLQALGCPWQLLWHCSGDTCTLYCIPQLQVLPGAFGRGGAGKFMWHSRLTPSPTLPCTSSGGGGRSVTKVQSSRAQQLPALFQQLLSSPAQQMETGIILSTTANEGAVKTEDTLQVQHKLQEAEKRRKIRSSITRSSLSHRDHFAIKTGQHNLLMKHFI